MNRITGRSAFLALLKDEGITHLFGNPGTTELPIMHALKEHPDLTYVMAMQESLVVAIADGYSRASGRLVACNVHVAPGLGNAMGSLFNAQFTGTPMILTAGQQEQGHGLMEPVLYGPLVQMAEPLVKWAVEVTRLEDLPRIVRRAAKIATTPPTGPVFISLPGDILNAEAGIELGRSTRVDTRVKPSDEALQALAQRILKAERPVIIAGDEIVKSDALQEAAMLAETLGCPAYQSLDALRRAFPVGKPVLHGRAVAAAEAGARGAVALRSDDRARRRSVADVGLQRGRSAARGPADRAGRPGRLGSRQELRRRDRAEGRCEGNPARADSGAEGRRRRGARGARQTGHRRAGSRRTGRRGAPTLVEQISKNSDRSPIDPDWLALQVVEAMPDNAILVDEGLTSSRQMLALRPHRDRYGYHALASGGIGWGLPASVGVSLANPDRPVVCFSGDGSAMYSIQALWTAAHHKLPLTFVIANNGGYRIIKQRLLAFHGDDHYVGMDFVDRRWISPASPNRSGWKRCGSPIRRSLKPALSSAFSRPGRETDRGGGDDGDGCDDAYMSALRRSPRPLASGKQGRRRIIA